MNPWIEMLWPAFWMLLNKKNKFFTCQQLDIHHLFTDTQKLKKKLKKFFWNQSMKVIFSNQVSFITGSTENGVFHSNIAFKSGTKYTQYFINWYLKYLFRPSMELNYKNLFKNFSNLNQLHFKKWETRSFKLLKTAVTKVLLKTKNSMNLVSNLEQLKFHQNQNENAQTCNYLSISFIFLITGLLIKKTK